MNTLKEGQKAPDFELLNTEGKKTKLSQFKGKRVVLYFYPKDDTSGCTKQACDFRDHIGEITKLGAVVIGVSNDDLASHQKFTQKYNLNFMLLSDTEKKVVNLYGVYGPKQMMGRTYEGIHRTTFIIDETGKIIKVFEKVSAQESLQEVMEVLKK